MKVLKIVLTLVLCGASVFLLSCASSSTSVSQNQTATVKRGNITVDVTAAGNLALSHTEDLAFEIGGTTQEALTVEEVLVAEGDTVKEGQELAKLDTATLKEAVKTAERATQKAEIAVQTAELGVQTAEAGVEEAVKTADATVEAEEEAVKSAEFALEEATNDYYKLTSPYIYTTYRFMLPESVDSIGVAEQRMEEAQEEFQKGLEGEQYSLVDGMDKLSEAQTILAEARTKLAQGLVAGVRPDTIDYWTLRAKQIQMEKAQIALDTANNDLEEVEDTSNLDEANRNLTTAKNNLDKAKIDLAIAQDDLDKANSDLEKAVIVAPFDGFITTVNVAGGDEVTKGTVAVQIADPDKFEADIMVSEMDIMQVKLGGEAQVQVDAMPELTLPAKVTHISPTATVESGVVNYKVKVEVESLEAAIQEQQQAMVDISSGELPEPLKQAIAEGRITQEQAEEMLKQGQQGQGEQQQQTTTTLPEDFQLSEGLTVTVNIIVQEKSDILLVPNGAISTQGGQAYVQVLTSGGTTEERTIQTGISDWQYTEVTEGLSEGEQVVIPQATATPTTTGTGGTFRIPGGLGR